MTMPASTADSEQPGRSHPAAGRGMIIVPAYNEEEALPRTLAAILAGCDLHVVVVDDGSTDRTAAVTRELTAAHPDRLAVLSLPFNVGIGGAVQTGYQHAFACGCAFAVQMDADGQHDIASLAGMVATFEAESLDVCVGSRFLDPSCDGYRSTRARRLGIRFFATVISALTRTRVTDPTSGYRICGKRALKLFAEHYPDDFPEPESLAYCARVGLRVGEHPVSMLERQGGVSSIHRWKAVEYMVKVTVAILVDAIRGTEQD
jgi:glycosyltransferase involved in cell wall biosynthesis